MDNGESSSLADGHNRCNYLDMIGLLDYSASYFSLAAFVFAKPVWVKNWVFKMLLKTSLMSSLDDETDVKFVLIDWLIDLLILVYN